MNPGEPAAALQRALALSQQLLIAAMSQRWRNSTPNDGGC